LNFQIKVPGKLILIGEYAVLEGADSLVASVDRYVTIDISDSEQEYWTITSNLSADSLTYVINQSGKLIPQENQSSEYLSRMDFVIDIINHICEKISKNGVNIKPFDLNIDTSQFYIDENQNKLGLGSSAALTVSLILSIAYLFEKKSKLFANSYELFRLACDIHFRAQGNRGSGIDIAASIYGGINIYNIHSIEKEDKNRLKPVSVLDNLFILPIWTGVSASTSDFLSKLDEYRLIFETEYQDMMSRLIFLSEAGCQAYIEKNCSDFLDIVHDYYQVLKNISSKSKIPIISDIHNKIEMIVRSNGGIYKPSGAGGGDIGLAFSDSQLTLDKVKKELAHHRIGTLSIGISTDGVIVGGN
jgi:phosphomevalonate kinase